MNELQYAIEVEDLWFSYTHRPVLEGVTFKVSYGDFIAILGPNGGGKTTLLKLLLGLLKPQKGRVLVLGKEPAEARKEVGYLPQNTDFNLAFPITVAELVSMGRLGYKKRGKPFTSTDMEAVQAALELVGLWEERYTPIGRLSGGQRQRAFIARAIATTPKLLFLDEPTANVDPEFQVDLYQILKELNKEITIVVITHDIGVISSHVRSVACVNRTLVFHEEGKITQEMLDMAYPCPVELVAHGIPHRVFHKH